jgi:enediyne biosynthesis protein E4
MRHLILLTAALFTVSAASGQPDLNPGRGQFRHIDILDFSRGLTYIPEGERVQVEEWLADHVDVNESDLGVKAYDPTVKIFRYEYDMTAPTAQDYPIAANESAYLHFSEETVIQFRDLGGHNVGDPITIPGNPEGDPLSAASRVRRYMWDTERYACYVADSGFQTWQTNRILTDLGNDYEGVFLDEHNPGFRSGLYQEQNSIVSGGAVREFGGLRPSDPNLPGKNYNALDAAYSAETVAWLTALHHSLETAGKFILINPAQYWWIDLSEAEYTAAGGVTLESVHVPFDWSADGYQGFAEQVARAVANGVLVDLFGRWCVTGAPGYTAGNYASNTDRYRMWRLASYYFLRGEPDAPGIVYFDPTFCNDNDTFAEYAAEWAPAYETDIGDPEGDGYVIYQGSAACASHKVFAREYTFGMVLVRPQDSWACTEYGDATAVTIPLTRPMRILAADGTLGEPLSSVQLRNAEAVVLLEQSNSKYSSKSGETGLNYEGTPYCSVGFDYDYNPDADRNLEDLMVTIGSGSPLGLSSFHQATGLSISRVPEFDNRTAWAFPDPPTRPQVGLGGVSVADMDNDGDLDMFCASGTSSTPHLYRNEGDGTYEDVTVSYGLSISATNSWSGTWADYDRDGWVDLLITRGGGPGIPPESMTGQPACLLRNRLDPVLGTGAFEDVTAAVGLSAGGANVAASISACWGDIDNTDNDNRLDLYLAEYRLDPAGVQGRLFVQQSNGTFLDQTASRLPTSLMCGQAAVQFADLDLDEDLDLVVGSRLADTGAQVFWNDGAGNFTNPLAPPLTLPSVGGVSGMKIWDQDLDGRPDLLLTTRDSQQTPHFFHNLPTEQGVVLVDETGHVGLDEGHACGGLTVLDWNRDGDKDVFLGRPVSTGQVFYRAERLNGTNLPAENTVCVRLSSPQGVNNRAGIGARVSVQVDGVWHHQWVDGGSGRGGQDDLALTFAVPSATVTYPMRVLWPNGWTQTIAAEVVHYDLDNPPILQDPYGDDPQVLVDDTNPTVVNSTVKGSTSFVVDVNGSTSYYWVFSWETEYRSDWSLDAVTVYSSPCVPTTTTYTATTIGVSPSHSRQASGRYRHELKVRVNCAAPCTIPFTVSSTHRLSPTVITSTSTQKTLKIMFCPSQG